MSALKKIEELKTNKPYLGFAKLRIGFHPITCFRVVKNKYGKKSDGSNKSILIELKNEVLFLPQYFWRQLNEENIRELNSDIESGNEAIYLYFGGKQESNE